MSWLALSATYHWSWELSKARPDTISFLKGLFTAGIVAGFLTGTDFEEGHRLKFDMNYLASAAVIVVALVRKRMRNLPVETGQDSA